MGVQGLWQVLAPVGRRVDIATLQTKTLAIDASIWLTQFVKAMRDRETGKMLAHAHVIGSLRRILKLLHHKIKPLFVFDGGVPVLKRRIMQQRRQRSDHQKEKLKRTAHKLLLNQMMKSALNPAPPNAAVADNFVLSSGKPPAVSQTQQQQAKPVHGDQPKEGQDEEEEDIEWDESSEDEDKSGTEEQKTKPTGANTKETEKEKEKEKEQSSRAEIVEDILEQIADEGGNVNLGAVRDLPEQLQYATLARLKDKRLLRENKRSEFIPVAADPLQYSHLQLKHFLKDSHFKRKLDRMEEDLTKRAGDGKKIASDPTREYILTDSAAPLKKPKLSTPKHSFAASKRNQNEAANNGKADEDEGDLVLTIPASSGSTAAAAAAAADLFPEDIFRHVAKQRPVSQTDEAVRTAALSSAMETASNLTSWAAHAVSHAIRTRTQPSKEPPAVSEVVVIEEEEVRVDTVEKPKQVVDLVSSGLGEDEIEWGNEDGDKRNHNDNDKEEDAQTLEVQGSMLSTTSTIPRVNDSNRGGNGRTVAEVPMTVEVVHRSKPEDAKEKRSNTTDDRHPPRSVESPPDVVEVAANPQPNNDTLEDRPVDIPEDQAANPRIRTTVVEPVTEVMRKSVPSNPRSMEEATTETETHNTQTIRSNKYKVTSAPNEVSVDKSTSPAEETPSITELKVAERRQDDVQVRLEQVNSAVMDESVDDLIQDEAAAEEESKADERELSKQAEEQLQVEARQDLVHEEARLVGSRNRAARDADGVTPAMLEDVKELLILFGLPFVESPMEAEAQCAALESTGVVDGVVTDDCDAFLFGASNVYKNIFSDNKYVEVYKSKDVSSQLGLGRKDMIALALLLGSDYTTGIKGIGIVNATEVISSFPGYNGLKEFREWVHSNQRQNMKKNKHNKNKGRKGDADSVRPALFKASHHNASKKWLVTETFPSRQVIAAYEQPTVCQVAEEGLRWKEPNKDAIVKFLSNQLGWSEEESLRKIKGPIDNYLKREVQTRLDSFFVTYNHKNKFAAIRSKRMQKAVVGMMEKTQTGAVEDEDDAPLFLDAVGNAVPAMPSSASKKTKHKKEDPRASKNVVSV